MENIIISEDITQNRNMDSVKNGDNINEFDAEISRGNKNTNNFEQSLEEIDKNKGDSAVVKAIHEGDVEIVHRENDIDNKDTDKQEFSNVIKLNDDASEKNENSLEINDVKYDDIDNKISSDDIQNEKFNHVAAEVTACENAEYIVGIQANGEIETAETADDTCETVANIVATADKDEENVDEAAVCENANQPNILDNPLDMISNFMNDVETEAVQAMGTLRRELNRIMQCLNFIRENADDE